MSVHKSPSETCEGGVFRPRLFLGGNLPARCACRLKDMGYDIRLLPPYKNLQRPVATHPDMLLSTVGDKIFVPRDYFLKNEEVFDGVCVTLVDADVRPEYPWDVRMNALIMGDTLFGRVDVICKEILESVKAHVFIKQGYAACSTLVIAENAAVTADRSIAKALTERGVDVCLIEQGHIALDGYDFGFIGGASVRLQNDTVAFFGDLKYHPDHKKISEFAKKHQTQLISLSDEPLADYGGGKCIF